MEKEINYSFDDEPVRKFCYDFENKKIEIHFRGYYNLIDKLYIDKPCIWIIENWEYGKCRIGNEAKLYNINDNISIFKLILYMKYNEENEFEMFINTGDNKYLTIFFKNPKLTVI